MSQTSTTVKVVMISLMLFFVIAIGFTLYESYRSVKEDAGEAENQGYEEVPFSETSSTEIPLV